MLLATDLRKGIRDRKAFEGGKALRYILTVPAGSVTGSLREWSGGEANYLALRDGTDGPDAGDIQLFGAPAQPTSFDVHRIGFLPERSEGFPP